MDLNKSWSLPNAIRVMVDPIRVHSDPWFSGQLNSLVENGFGPQHAMIDDTGRYVFSTVEYGQGGPSCTHLIVLAGTTYVTCFLQIGSSKDMVPQNVSWLIIMFTEENAKKNRIPCLDGPIQSKKIQKGGTDLFDNQISYTMLCSNYI
jgi:hypothetical protein